MTTYEPVSALQVFGGDVVYAADFNSLLAITPRTYIKASATARNTTVTFADDPELTGIAIEGGFYDIEFIGLWTQATTTTQKIKTRWTISTSWNNPVRNCIGAGSANTGAPSAVTDATMQGYNADNQDATYNTSTSASFSVFREIAYNVNVFVDGFLSFQWAQSVSSGNNTTLQAGSGFRIRRLTP